MLETGDIIEARSKLDALLNEMADKSAGLRFVTLCWVSF